MNTTTPVHGDKILPVAVDEEAINNPERIVYTFQKSAKASDGFEEVSAARFANAVNRAAHWLESLLGKGKDFPTIGYIGPADLRYQTLANACIKTGYKILLNSPRNSVDGHINVIQKSQCNIWLLPESGFGNIKDVFKIHPMKVLDCPDLSFFIDETPVEHYPYNKTLAEAAMEPTIVLHTSGSTGLPKPIVHTHALAATLGGIYDMEHINGKPCIHDYWRGCKTFSTFPMFHAAGVFVNLYNPFFQGIDIVLGSPENPVNANSIEDVLNHIQVDGLMVPPSTVDDVAFTPATYEMAKSLKWIGFGGGPVGYKAGSALAEVTMLTNIIGSTEAALFGLVQPDKEDWQYFHFHPKNGVEFRESTGGLYELVVVRKPEVAKYQGYFFTFPDVDEVSTKDLYEKHPTKPDYWLYKGRADDVIVFSNGEELNPVTMEQVISEHPEVRSAIIVGQARFQPAVLIELSNPRDLNDEERAELLKSIQPFINTANKGSPTHGHLKDGFAIFTSPSKPFLRAGKGTVQRQLTVALFEPEINELYASVEDAVDCQLDVSSLEALTADLRDLVAKIAEVDDLKVDTDVFASGSFDSLLVFTLLRQVRAALKKEGVEPESIQASSIYNNPKVELLATFLYNLAHPGEKVAVRTQAEEMQIMFDKYAKQLPTQTAERSARPAKASVIVTGTTGALGSYLLDSLLALPHVEKVYCLNRAVNGEERQKGSSSGHGLKTDFERATFFKTDMSEERFGLEQAQYDELLANATHVIHNQWQVDFNLSLPSFEPHVRGVSNLIHFSAESKLAPQIFFISSIGTTQGKVWENPVPEQIITDWNSAAMGYGSSKLVSEVLLVEAQKKAGVRTAVCRVGQICGPIRKETGQWNVQEWFPTIVSTSKYLRAVPEYMSVFDRIDWIPIDILDKVILDLADCSKPESLYPENETTPFFHTLNPESSYWKDIYPALVENIGEGCEVVSWTGWVARICQSADRGEIEQNRGIKLLEFYENIGEGAPLALLETEKTCAKSPQMATMGPVSQDWLKLFMRQWKA